MRSRAVIDSRLYPYQVAGAQFLAERASAMLADDMGIGKTAQAIAACDLAGVQTAVVVCPGIARENWKREFASWGQRNRRCYVVRGTPDLLNVRALTADVLIIHTMMSRKEEGRGTVAIFLLCIQSILYHALTSFNFHSCKCIRLPMLHAIQGDNPK